VAIFLRVARQAVGEGQVTVIHLLRPQHRQVITDEFYRLWHLLEELLAIVRGSQ
jgi:hypothetical protein